MQDNFDKLTYIITGYDGKMFIRGNRTLPWHKFEIKESKIQHIPKSLQQFPPRYNIFQKILIKVWRFYMEPKRSFFRIIHFFLKYFKK